MMMRAILTGMAALLACTGAWAALDAATARKTFFGVDMSGVVERTGTPWRECIEPSGKTTYWFAGTVDHGRLAIRQDGALCFSYASRNYQNPACFFAERQGPRQWRFTEDFPDDPSVFVTQTYKRVKSCSAEVPVS